MTELLLPSRSPQILIPAPGARQRALETAVPRFGYPGLVPTEDTPVVARRIPDGSSAKGALLIRTLTDVLQAAGGVCFDEFIYRYTDDYSDVNDGFQQWSWRAVAAGKVKRWLIGPAARGDMPTVEFAFRNGLLASTYHSSGEGPYFWFGGYGHGRMTTTGVQISLDGGGPNLDDLDEWPMHGEIRGSLLTIAATFTITLGLTATAVADITITQGFDDTGLREFGTIVAANDVDFAWQDTYTLMIPFSRYDINKYGPSGETKATIDLVTPDTGWTSTTADLFQGYHTEDPTLIMTGELVYDQPVRRPDLSLPAWSLNRYGRALVRNIASGIPLTYPKGYVFACSSEEGLPRTAWPLTGTYEWQNRRRTHYRAGGPL